jgi:hypothetical protein
MSDRTDDLGHGGEEGVRIRMAPIAIEVVGRRCLDDAAGIHHVDPVGVARHDAEIVRDEKQRPAQSAGKVSEKRQNLRLHGDVECCRRLVRDDESWLAGDRDSNHDTLAHTPTELVRIGLGFGLCIRDADLLEKVDRLRFGGAPGHPAMTHQRLGDLAPDAQAWVQRCHRLLENDADLVASDVPDLFW